MPRTRLLAQALLSSPTGSKRNDPKGPGGGKGQGGGKGGSGGQGSNGPLTTGPSSTKWRIYFNRHTTPLRVREVEMRAYVGGPDQCTGGTASDNSSVGVAASAFDDNAATYWESQNGDGSTPNLKVYLEYEFPSAVQMGEIAITAHTGSMTPIGAQLQYWDGSQYVDSWIITADPTWTDGEQRTFAKPGAGEAWRLTNVVPFEVGAYSTTEMQMRTSPGGADQCTGGQPLASAQFTTSNNAAKAFDDNTSTYWATADEQASHSIGYKFASSKEIVEFTLTARTDADWQTPRNGDFQKWTGNGWSTQWSISTGAYSPGQTKTFTRP